MNTPPTFEFADAEPITRVGGPGRTAEPNPFLGIITEIALKINPQTGKPVTKSFDFPYKDTEEDQKTLRRYKRQLTDAGLLVNPQVTVYSPSEPATRTNAQGKKAIIPNTMRITFWTVPKIHKPRKPETSAS